MADFGPGDSIDLDVEDVFLKGSSFSPRKKDPHVTGEIMDEEELSTVALHTPEKDRGSSDGGVRLTTDGGVRLTTDGDVRLTTEPLDVKPLCLGHFFNHGIIQSPIQPNGSQSNLSPGLLFLTSSPRMIQKELQDGSVQQYAINTPLIRKSRLLEFRRITSELDNSLSTGISGSRKLQIEGAVNMYDVGSIEDIMGWRPENNKHMVLIFHCEFSSHRGPNMMKMLRNTDRKRHLHCYPFLCYPEIYLLQGGYSHFYRHYKDLCEPQQYVEMNNPQHWQELRFYKSLYKPSTWHGKSVNANSIIL